MIYRKGTINVEIFLTRPINTYFFIHFIKLVEGSECRKAIRALDSADAIVVLSRMLEINEVGDSTYAEWGDPDRFFLEG